MELIYGIVFLYMVALVINILKSIPDALDEIIESLVSLYERLTEKHNATQSIPEPNITEPKTVYKGWRNDDIINKVLNELIPPTENQKMNEHKYDQGIRR